MILVTSRGVARVSHLEKFLGERVVLAGFSISREQVRCVAGWGMKATSQKARDLAKRLEVPYWALEDGFLRSVDVGPQEPPLSLVVDDLGIYYDASRPSRLETLIANDISQEAFCRAGAIKKAWCDGQISKYNYSRSYRGLLPERYVLVVDQTFGDASISGGLASADSFERMMDCALAENPDAQIVLKVHPEVMLGRKRGHFDLTALAAEPRIFVLGEDAHPATLIQKAEAVYVVTSQIGFEAVLWGRRVRTFGMPFYAGWGLTDDALPTPDCRKRVSLENLIYAALVAYPRYIDPETGALCEVERVISWMSLQRRMRERFPEQLYAVGFSFWKKPIVRDFFQGSSVCFVDSAHSAPIGANFVVWGKKTHYHSGVVEEPIRLEDGFLRSVGLGVDLIRPLSWVMDSRGIYYDTTRPSDLEKILAEQKFDEELIQRASILRSRIVVSGVTKYNVGKNCWQRPDGAVKVILVPGQVETDASIAYGASDGTCYVRRNIDLLRIVRKDNPDAYVVYKPHPDVLAGLRVRGVDEDFALQYCDVVVVDMAMGELLLEVDEVHVITSLAGFEALLRGKKVTCYGQPFYAGWGLTTDILPVERRQRQLTLDELVAGCLFLYPAYLSRTTQRFTSPERALDELLAWREKSASELPWWRKILRIILRFYKH